MQRSCLIGVCALVLEVLNVGDWLPAAEIAPFGSHPPTPLHEGARRLGCLLPQNWPGRRLAAWLRHLVKATANGPVDVKIFGLPMRLWLKDNACERRLMVTPQFFDPDELAILRQMIAPGFQFIDLGANAGIYTIFVGHLAGPGARILSVEPQPEMLARLRVNLALNRMTVRVAATAVSDREGEAQFAVDSTNLGYTSINTSRQGRGERRIVRMRTRTLIDLVREAGFSRIDALKADIEGAEDRAIIPFIEQAPSSLWPKLFIIEDNRPEWQRDCFAFLEHRGYRRISFRGNVMLMRGDLAHRGP